MDLGYLVAVIAVILVSMTLHEAMHAYVSYWLGDDTAKAQGRLTLNPIAHIDPFLTLLLPISLALLHLPVFGGAKPVPFDPTRVKYGEIGAALVAIAGPLTNLLLAFITFGVFAFMGAPSFDTIPGMILQLAITVNLGFFIFNIIPIPPLDGSRVLYAFAPEGARRVMEMIERYGIFLIFAIILVASPLIGSFMLGAMRFFLQLFSWVFGVQVTI
ncbi:site-2 protease family protein [Candidatus Saccharibacteria bacterium]|nr:MAG: site-2 protease family protein [Candidatus Saccharibacteria bacterium]